jgi:hypothetical protein
MEIIACAFGYGVPNLWIFSGTMMATIIKTIVQLLDQLSHCSDVLLQTYSTMKGLKESKVLPATGHGGL